MYSVYLLCWVDTGLLGLLQQPEKQGVELRGEDQGPVWLCTQGPFLAPSHLSSMLTQYMCPTMVVYMPFSHALPSVTPLPVGMSSSLCLHIVPCRGQPTTPPIRSTSRLLLDGALSDSCPLKKPFIHRHNLHSTTHTDTRFIHTHTPEMCTMRPIHSHRQTFTQTDTCIHTDMYTQRHIYR